MRITGWNDFFRDPEDRTMISEKLMKPAQHAEHALLTAILNGEFPPGTALPGERKLADMIGVTRPTLRETLQRMAREGWLTIRHGKPTLVRDYMSEGGAGVLSTLARFGDELPRRFVEHFLSLRVVMMAKVARMALEHHPEDLEDYLSRSHALADDAGAFTDYDWNLQLLMAGLSGNPFFRIIMNDFDFLFRKMGAGYFADPRARTVSLAYYRELIGHVGRRDGDAVEACVARVMQEALDLWKELMP
jgi:GntR family negative regulator for fad regulon and positive regulator of fabA